MNKVNPKVVGRLLRSMEKDSRNTAGLGDRCKFCEVDLKIKDRDPADANPTHEPDCPIGFVKENIDAALGFEAMMENAGKSKDTVVVNAAPEDVFDPEDGKDCDGELEDDLAPYYASTNFTDTETHIVHEIERRIVHWSALRGAKEWQETHVRELDLFRRELRTVVRRVLEQRGNDGELEKEDQPDAVPFIVEMADHDELHAAIIELVTGEGPGITPSQELDWLKELRTRRTEQLELSTRSEKLQKSNGELAQQNWELRQLLEEQQKENNRLRRVVSDTGVAFRDKRYELEQSKGRVHDLKGQVHQLGDRIQDETRLRQHLSVQLDAANRRIKTLQDPQRRILELESALKGRNQRLKEGLRNERRFKSIIAETEQNLAGARAVIIARNERIDKLSERVEHVTQERDKFLSKIAELEAVLMEEV